MIKIIIIVVALLAGLILAPELSANKGYILLSFNGYTTYETTIINAIFVAFIFYFLLLCVEWVLRRLLSMNSLTRNWFALRKTRKAQKNSLLGMMALFEGNDKQAYKLLEKSAPRSESPALAYISAAKAAHNQGKYAQRDEYFQRAYDTGNSSQLAAGLAWAELQVEAKQYQEASETLNELTKQFPKNQRVSKLYLKVYPALGQWKDYLNLLTRKRNALTFDDAERTARLVDAYQHIFRDMAAKGADVLELFWDKKVPRWIRKETVYQYALLEAQIEAGHYKLAETFLLEKLNKQFSVELLAYVDRLQLSDHYPLISLLESKLEKQPESGELHQALAYLQIKEDKTTAAIKHLQESIKTIPSVKDFALLANLLQKEERNDEANEYYRQGLLLATAKDTKEVITLE